MAGITVVGAGGFIGSRLARRLEAMGTEYEAFGRGEDLAGRDLGRIVYCAGVTSSFLQQPFDTVEAHVCHLNHLLRDCRSESLVYLSSARLYRGVAPRTDEDAPLHLLTTDRDQLYDASKAMGESLVLSTHPGGRVVRLSHVYGVGDRAETFISSVLHEAVTTGEVTLRTSLDSSRDYVDVDDVVECLIKIAGGGRHRIYNLGSGRAVSNAQLAERLEQVWRCRVRVAPGAPRVDFPALDVGRVTEEFGFSPASVLDDLPELLEAARHDPAAS